MTKTIRPLLLALMCLAVAACQTAPRGYAGDRDNRVGGATAIRF